VLLMDGREFQFVAGNILEAQHGAPAGRTALGFYIAARQGFQNDVERAAIGE